MQPATWKTRTCLSLVVGLLVLAGICSGARPALAQLDCPLPAGVTPPPDPPVTAQQVVEGSATLAEFALAARDQVQEPGRRRADAASNWPTRDAGFGRKAARGVPVPRTS